MQRTSYGLVVPTGAEQPCDGRSDSRFLFAGIVMATAAAAGDITIRTYLSDDTLLRIGPYAFEGGKTLNLTVGIG